MKIMYLGVVVAMVGVVNLSHASWEGYVLVKAKPVSVRFLSELQQVSADEENGNFFHGSLFETTLTNIQVIHGSLGVRRLTVELTATHKEVLANKNEIYVLLDLRGDKPRALYWGSPYSVICIPKRLVEEQGIGDDFAIEDRRHNRLCTNAEWFQ